MKIAAAHIYRIRIPFKKPFRHATAERSTTDNIVVAITLDDGTVGYGEGLPREYVTGESQEDVIAALGGLGTGPFEADIESAEDLVDHVEAQVLSTKNFPHDKENNTARCALELSLLDAYCRCFKKRFSDIADAACKDEPRFEERAEVHYDGVLSLDSPARCILSAIKMKLFGFDRLKLKGGADAKQTLRSVRIVRAVMGRSVDLRIDANGAWDMDLASHMVRRLNAFSLSSIEQPLSHANLMQMRELKRISPIPLMLDESLCSLADARRAIDEDLCDLFNIRLSKCGGFINALRIARMARRSGIGCQLGCLVGETGILSAAGRHFASITPSLRYLEGSYDRYLLKDNIIKGDISFGRGGRAPALEGYGLGVEVDRAKLDRYATFDATLVG